MNFKNLFKVFCMMAIMVIANSVSAQYVSSDVAIEKLTVEVNKYSNVADPAPTTTGVLTSANANGPVTPPPSYYVRVYQDMIGQITAGKSVTTAIAAWDNLTNSQVSPRRELLKKLMAEVKILLKN